MAGRGRPTAPLVLDNEDREALQRWRRRWTSSHGLAMRARIVLESATGATNVAVADKVGCSPQTVGKWRQRFIDHGIDGLLDEPRVGRPREVDDAKIEQIIVETLETTPPGGSTHWSTRDMAARVGLSQSTISRVWRTFGLKPHLTETWKLSKDPQFIDKVRDVVGLYLDPPERAVVLCVDEKSQIQALDRSSPTLPMLPHTPERATHDYIRNGTTDLFAAMEVATGRVHTQLYSRHRAVEFKKFLNHLDREVPDDLEVHLILDNYSTHKTPEIKRWLVRHPRFVLHFTPTSSSWMNLVERWFAALTTQKLQRSAHRSVTRLNADIDAWTNAWNADPKPFVWRKTADEIFDSIASYLQRTADSGH